MSDVTPAPAKKSWQSKTLWANLFMAGIAFFPGVNQFFLEHPQALMAVFLIVNTILRFATKGKVQLLSILLLVGMTTMGCACLNIDRAMAADDGGQPTLFLGGCGSAVQKGVLGIEIAEGATPDCELRFVVPAAKCDRDSCAHVQFWRTNGSPGFAAAVPKGETEVRFKLADVLESNAPITIEDEQVRLVRAGLYYTGPDGLEQVTRAKGHLHLIVLKEGYKPLPCGGPEVAWKVKLGPDCTGHVSTGYRSALCGEGCGA